MDEPRKFVGIEIHIDFGRLFLWRSTLGNLQLRRNSLVGTVLDFGFCVETGGRGKAAETNTCFQIYVRDRK